MNGFGPNHTRYMILTNPDGFARQLARIYTTYCFEAEDTIPIVMGQHETNFIHMGGEHHLQALGPLSPGLGNEHIAEGINLNIVCERAHLFQYDGPHLAFITRDRLLVNKGHDRVIACDKLPDSLL